MRELCVSIFRSYFLCGLVLAGPVQSQTLRPSLKSECLTISRASYPAEARRQGQQGRVEVMVQLERVIPGEETAKVLHVEPTAPGAYPLLTPAAVAAAAKLGGCRIPLGDPDRASFKTAVEFVIDDVPRNPECNLSELNALSLPVNSSGPLAWMSIAYKIVSKPESPDVSVIREIKVLGQGGDDPRMKEYLKQLGELQLPKTCADERDKSRHVSFARRGTSGFAGYATGSYGLYAFNERSQKALREMAGLAKEVCPVKASLMVRPQAFNELLNTSVDQDPRIAAWLRSAELNPALSLVSGKLQVDIACQIDNGYLHPIF